MDKPISLSVKDYIIRKLSVKMMTSEEILNAVVTHQFQSASEAMKTNKSIEISGFGKFYFNTKKAIKKLNTMIVQRGHLYNQLANPEVSEKKKQLAQIKIDSLTQAIEYLKPMLENETVTDLRGMEEQVNSSRESQGDN